MLCRADITEPGRKSKELVVLGYDSEAAVYTRYNIGSDGRSCNREVGRQDVAVAGPCKRDAGALSLDGNIGRFIRLRGGDEQRREAYLRRF